MGRNVVMCWTNSMFRLFLCGLALISGSIGLTDPRSLAFLAAGTNHGYQLTLALMAFAAVGMVDVLINDMLPDSMRWSRVLAWRHFGYCGMAFCYVAQLFITQETVRSPGLTAYYLWNVGAIMFVAFWDANLRAKDAACKLVCN